MAVKASASVTLSRIVGIESWGRWYLLQSSTLAAPAAPAAHPPSSPWSATEPSYSAGSTESLWFADCTAFSDGSFDWSAVSLSSSYEAAKTAYNSAIAAGQSASDALAEAQAAQQKADDVSASLDAGLGELSETVNRNGELLDEAVESIAVSTARVSEVEQTVDGVRASVEQVTVTAETALGQARTNMERIEAYMSFLMTEDGDPLLELGASDSKFKSQLSNATFSFLEDNQVVMEIGGHCIYIDNAEVRETLRFGSFAWVNRANRNMALKWIGGDD